MFRKTYKVRYDGQCEIVDDQLIDDKLINLYVNNELVEQIHCYPENLEELAIGKLVSQGRKPINWSFHSNTNEVRIEILESERLNTARLSEKTYVSAPVLIDSMCDLLNNPLHQHTGAVHLAGIYTVGGECVAKFEDIGRHNAIDKVIGWLVKNKVDPLNKVLLCSGRLPMDMALKCVLSGIEILASKAPVLGSAIEFSERFDLTIIGFVRENRMNIYTHPQRIKEVCL